MISVIIVSFKEPKSIGRCIACIANRKYEMKEQVKKMDDDLDI